MIFIANFISIKTEIETRNLTYFIDIMGYIIKTRQIYK